MSSDNQYTFSLQSATISSVTAAGVFGTLKTLESAKTLSFAQKLISDRTQGNSKITALAAQTISDDVQLDTGGISPEVLEILTGVVATSSNGGTVFSMPNQLAPYFALCGQAFPDEGDVLHFFPYCKITSDFTWKFEFGKIVVPQFKFETIEHPTLGYMYDLFIRPDGGAITFPPQIL